MLPIKLIVVEVGPRTLGTCSFCSLFGRFGDLEVRGKVGLESQQLPLGQQKGAKAKGTGKGAAIIQGQDGYGENAE